MISTQYSCSNITVGLLNRKFYSPKIAHEENANRLSNRNSHTDETFNPNNCACINAQLLMIYELT